VSLLVDTNVLLRRADRGHADHRTAVDSVERLLLAGEALHVVPQNIAEFWSVATRPRSSNGLGWAAGQTQAEIDRVERVFALLRDIPQLYDAWKRLVMTHGVLGRQVYDTRLVAALEVHGIDRILTFNIGDFVRYGVTVLDPATV
jgi:predicted nucleic acid-binding protein